jgi:CO dehydrogenase/acetyl-CoA synthase alpha subunit
MLSGNRSKQYPALQEKYGDEVPDELDKLAKDTKYYKFTKEELLQVIEDSKTSILYALANPDFYAKMKS